ncbi:hypothetical protein HB364_22115 [Pseudoflavitalea sp. X16]|uniref:flavodoxin domain-containing protein n=1 Tax=Paraflavitalea devenefica TaxID=2716334 RepID=UPI0014230550|nr:flavodoxin domain-containing protein [Paraflavitalea devenefica]NII27794.1 hypothetical protein [Paraflavitalea devenefica]
MKGIIIYKGKYGATREYADMLSKELNLPVFTPTITGGQLIDADYVLIGSAVYIGKLQLQSWLIRNQEWLKSKKLFFFIVCGTPAAAKEKTAKIIADNIPRSLRNNPVFFLKGRMIMRKLSWTDRLLLKLGARLARDPQEKKAMLQDFDGVEAARIQPLIQSLQTWESEKRQETLHTLY